MKWVFDIDGVVATVVPGLDYSKAEPIWENIRRINALYGQGDTIVFLTARGTETGIDWTEVTKAQFLRWNVKYHELHFGKPAADRYVDDKMATLFEIDRIIHERQNT